LTIFCTNYDLKTLLYLTIKTYYQYKWIYMRIVGSIIRLLAPNSNIMGSNPSVAVIFVESLALLSLNLLASWIKLNKKNTSNCFLILNIYWKMDLRLFKRVLLTNVYCFALVIGLLSRNFMHCKLVIINKLWSNPDFKKRFSYTVTKQT